MPQRFASLATIIFDIVKGKSATDLRDYLAQFAGKRACKSGMYGFK